jgi:hypothetical protein
MAITTRFTATKEKPISQAIVATDASPIDRHPEQRAKRLARSPTTSNINKHLAEINRPTTRINSVLQALRPTTDPATDNDPAEESTLNESFDLTPPTDKAGQVTPLASPTGVNQDPSDTDSNKANGTNTDDPSLQPRVRISEVTEEAGADACPVNATIPRRSILQNPTIGANQGQVCNTTPPQDDVDSSTGTPHIREIHDRQNMLFKEYSDDGMKETCYHVTGFAGLYPMWPIIEFSMAPTGDAKDD